MAKYKVTDSRLIPSRDLSRAGSFDTLLTYMDTATNFVYFATIPSDKPSEADIKKAIQESSALRKQHVGKEFQV